jgi:preprotein translocase subunit SecE
MRKFINYLKESYKELTQKVTWPSWSKLQSSAVLVLAATFILAIVIFLMDFTFQHLMELVYSL